MNQKFLSRGKCKANGEWGKGYLFYDEISGIASIVTYVNLNGAIYDLSEINIYEVIPESAGRYTGWNDINDKMIFEGDICRFTNYKTSYPHKYIGVIKYHKNINAVFVSKDYSTNLSDWKPEDFEVIGNVYDNPKMIGDDTA